MTYLPTADHDELRAMVRELAEERIAPRAAEIDETQEFPWDFKELLAQQDLLGTCVEERHGGTALDTIAQSILVEEIARADATRTGDGRRDEGGVAAGSRGVVHGLGVTFASATDARSRGLG